MDIDEFINNCSYLSKFRNQDFIKYAFTPSLVVSLEERIENLKIMKLTPLENLLKILNLELNINEIEVALPIKISLDNQIKLYQTFNLQSDDNLKSIDILNLIDRFYGPLLYQKLNNIYNDQITYRQKLIIIGFKKISEKMIILKMEYVKLNELDYIPIEILYMIVSYLEIKDLLNLVKSDVKYEEIIKDRILEIKIKPPKNYFINSCLNSIDDDVYFLKYVEDIDDNIEYIFEKIKFSQNERYEYERLFLNEDDDEDENEDDEDESIDNDNSDNTDILYYILKYKKNLPIIWLYKIFLYSCKYNQLEIVKLFLNEKYCGEIIDPTYTAILTTIVWNNIEVFKLLLSGDRIYPSNQDNILICGCKCNRLDIIKLLFADKRSKLEFLNIGKLIDNCNDKGLGIVEFLLNTEKVYFEISELSPFKYAIDYNNTELIKFLLKDIRFNPFIYNNDIIKYCFYKDSYYRNQKENKVILKLLLNDFRIQLTYQLNEFVIDAITMNYFDILQLLLIKFDVDPSIKDNLAIIIAVTNGYEDILQLLLLQPRINPADRDNQAIILACKYGHIKIVELLLADPRVDPTAQNNQALKTACTYNRLDIIKLLNDDYRIKQSKSTIGIVINGVKII